MLSKIACSILLIWLHSTGAFNPVSLTSTSANPVETMFGNGYICLHITDPIFESSPSFQALAVELAKRYNKTAIVHKIGSNETDFPHTESPETVHYEIDTTTTVLPPIASLVNKIHKVVALKCEKTGFFSNPNNCTKFFRCVKQTVKGKPWKIVEFDCPQYTIFDPSTSVCANSWEVIPLPNCILSEEDMKGLRGHQSTTTMEPVQEQVPDETTPETPTAPEQPTDEGEIDTHPTPEPPVCTMTGLFPDENDCQNFFQCLKIPGEFRLIKRSCEEKFIFDPNTNECRRPQEVNPKPACWHKRKRVGVRVTVNETTDIIEEVHEKPKLPPIVPIHPDTGEPMFPDESEEVVSTTEPEEYFDEIDSIGTTQSKKRPSTVHVVVTNTTVTERKEEIIDGVTDPSHHLVGKKKRITIPRPIGPKPIPQCEMEGKFPHPTDCSMYQKCILRGKNLKIYFFPCTPNGTVYDAESTECVEPKLIQPIPPVPDCAHWDDHFRPIFEDILNEEVDEETTTVFSGQFLDTTPSPDDGEGQIDPGQQHKKVVRTKNETTVVTEYEEPIDGPAPTSADYEVDESTTAPPAPLVKQPDLVNSVVVETETDGNRWKIESDESQVSLPCEDEAILMEQLRRERDEAEKKVEVLEKSKTKMEMQIKKMQKDLAAARKDKQKYENYIASMDKSIDDYKEKLAWYDQHCPLPTEFVQDEDDNSRSRRRRSLDLDVTPVMPKPHRRLRNYHDDPQDFDQIDDHHTKRFKVKQIKAVRPVHFTSETVQTDYRHSPFPNYDEGENDFVEEVRYDEESKPKDHGEPKGHRHRGHRSFWMLEQIPLLIFIVLAVLLVTITILGCMVVRRLQRVTTFTLSECDSQSSPNINRRRRKLGA